MHPVGPRIRYVTLNLLLSSSSSSATGHTATLALSSAYQVSCIRWQSSLAACGHVGVATRASGVLFMTRRDTCVRACSGDSVECY